MVRIYDYSIPQDEVLALCESALSSLGYETETYAPLDHHLVTRVRTIKRGLRKAEYVVFVKVEDRITVYVYAETRVFRRASEVGLKAGELTELDASRLRLAFQETIFEPITREFLNRGFKSWTVPDDNLKDDLEIREHEKRRLKKLADARRREAKVHQQTRIREREEVSLGRDRERWEAAREAQRYVTFFRDSLPGTGKPLDSKGWSLIEISRIVTAGDGRLREIFRDVVQSYPEYRGSGSMQWVINPDGRVVHAEVAFATSPFTPDDELENAISSRIRILFFPPAGPRSGYAVVSRDFELNGSYHNLNLTLHRPRFKDIMEHYPLVETETVIDTFFDTGAVPKR